MAHTKQYVESRNTHLLVDFLIEHEKFKSSDAGLRWQQEMNMAMATRMVLDSVKRPSRLSGSAVDVDGIRCVRGAASAQWHGIASDEPPKTGTATANTAITDGT